jgi:hypothetical protein
MKRTRFVQDAKLDPGRYYRHPADIIRDRRLTKEDRLEIVIAWEHGTQQLLASAAADGGVEDKLDQLRRLREELEQEPENAVDLPKQGLSS